MSRIQASGTGGASTGESGVTDVTASSPLSSSGGTTPNITITTGNFTDSTSGTDGISITGGTGSVISNIVIAQNASSLSTNGYLSSADFSAFNGKENPISFAAVGSSPNADGATISSSVITLEPADGTHPGLISTTSQTIAGNKTFLGNVTVNGISSSGGQILAENGTVLLPGIAFTNDPDCGLYIAGSEELGIAVAGVQVMDFKKSSGGFGNVGMGGAASTSDSYPLLIQRDVVSAGVYAQISNIDTAAYSKATWQLSADAGNNNGEISLFTSATPLAAYANAMTVRPSGNTGQLVLIGGDLSTGYISTFTGGDYTGTGETQRFNADHTNQFMQSVTSPSSPSSGLKYYNNAGVFSSKTTGGTVSSFSGSNTGDQTITLTGGVTGSGTGSFTATVVTNANLTGDVTSIGNATSLVATSNSTLTTLSALSLPYSQVTGTPTLYTSPLTTLGDTLYENATPANARLAGNTTTTKMMLSQTGTGSISAAPVWAALVSGDIPNNAANTSGTASTVVTNANLTGPVTSVGNATSVTANAITNAMLAQMNDQTIKGNVSGISASPSDLTAAQVATMIQAYIGANITYGIYY